MLPGSTVHDPVNQVISSEELRSLVACLSTVLSELESRVLSPLPRRLLLHDDRRAAGLRLQDRGQCAAARQAQGRRAPRVARRSGVAAHTALMPSGSSSSSSSSSSSIVGGAIARNRQLARSRPAFERALAQVDQDLAAAAASDRGWDRALLEASARRICAEQLGAEPEELTLVEVIDRPAPTRTRPSSTSAPAARSHRVVLGRRDGDWVHAAA